MTVKSYGHDTQTSLQLCGCSGFVLTGVTLSLCRLPRLEWRRSFFLFILSQGTACLLVRKTAPTIPRVDGSRLVPTQPGQLRCRPPSRIGELSKWSSAEKSRRHLGGHALRASLDFVILILPNDITIAQRRCTSPCHPVLEVV